MANKKVNIDITTTSNTSGADKAAAALEKIAAQQAKAAARAEEVAARELARAARAEAAAQRAADVETRRQERLVRQTETATQKKEAALRREEVAMARAQAAAEKAAAATERGNQKAITSAEKLAQQTEQLASKESANEARLAQLAADKAKRQTASKMQQAGFQVADIATQVSGGTSLLQAFSQQAPQLLGAFGPTGAIAGAFVGLAALGVQVFFKSGESAKLLSEKADEAAKLIKDGLGEVIRGISEDYDFGKTNMQNAQTYSQTLFDTFVKIAEKQREFSKQSLENSKELRKTELELAESMGLNVDKKNELARSSKEDAAIRKQQLDSDIAAQNEIIAKAELEKQQADEKKQKQQELVDGKTQELEVARIRLNQIEQERAKLKIKADEQKSYLQEAWDLVKAWSFIDDKVRKPGDVSLTSMQTQGAFTATQKLNSPVQTAERSYLEQKVKELDESLKNTGQFGADLVKAIQDSATASINLDTALKTASAEIKSLENTSAVTEIGAAVDLIKTQNEERSAKVETLIQGVNPVTSGEKAAMDVLQAALSDHEIKISEVPKVSAALSTLSAKISEAYQGQSQTVAEMITALNMSVLQSQQNLREIQSIKARLTTNRPIN